MLIHIELLVKPSCKLGCNIFLICLSHSCIIASKSASVVMPALSPVCLALLVSLGSAKSNKEQKWQRVISGKACVISHAFLMCNK